jgi:hypothetical protein
MPVQSSSNNIFDVVPRAYIMSKKRIHAISEPNFIDIFTMFQHIRDNSIYAILLFALFKEFPLEREASARMGFIYQRVGR